VIPRQICDNAGLDSTDVLNKLRMQHARGASWYGVDVDGAEGVRDNMEAFVWEPSLVKLNAISSATEAACLIISVDETVRNPQSEQVCRSRVASPNVALSTTCSPIPVQSCLLGRRAGHYGVAVGEWGDAKYYRRAYLAQHIPPLHKARWARVNKHRGHVTRSHVRILHNLCRRTFVFVMSDVHHLLFL
jgi:hypothetical protein